MGYKKEEMSVFQWHPAFYGGMQIELAGEKENLIFENEHQLGTKPKEVDVLIIKKNPEIEIQKNIGRIFRTYNIVEYKSPTDYLSVDDFYKVYAYACFYKSDAQNVNQIKAEEITITLATARHPRELIKHLETVRGYEVSGENGIYYIKGDFFPIQIIVTTELSEKENFWLRYLTDDIKEVETAKKIVSEYEKHQNEGLYQSVMELIVSANSETFREAKSMCQALKELFREDFEKEYEEKFERIRIKGHAEKLIELVCRKIAKGKEMPLIAEELEEDESIIKKIYNVAISFAPDFDAEKIYKVIYDK